MHRKEDNGQDERAAEGGPDPGFRSLVHAVVEAVKRCSGSRGMRFFEHWLYPRGLVELCLAERASALMKLQRTPKLKCRLFMKSIALEYDRPDPSGNAVLSQSETLMRIKTSAAQTAQWEVN